MGPHLAKLIGLTVVLLAVSCGGDDDESNGDDSGAARGGGGGTGGSECLPAGSPCPDPNSCCNGTTCISDVDQPDDPRCAANCLRGEDCASGCCAELVNLPQAVCAPVVYCE